jgi:hypothetical protein
VGPRRGGWPLFYFLNPLVALLLLPCCCCPYPNSSTKTHMASLPGVKQPKPQVSAKGLECSWYFDAMIRCGGIGNQMTALYKNGELDDCSATAEDLQTCLAIKWKSVGDIEAATAKLQESNLTESTTMGIVWEARAKPTLYK